MYNYNINKLSQDFIYQLKTKVLTLLRTYRFSYRQIVIMAPRKQKKSTSITNNDEAGEPSGTCTNNFLL